MKFIIKILKSFKNLLSTLLLVLATIFMINNRQVITINFGVVPIENIETRLFVLMLIFYFLGLITAILIYSNKLIKNTFRNIKQKKLIKSLE
ncbi:MAG: LapA family protein, partial [Proteobacteria bacterium]|nr:LapA family protein [Pseudomonadota bacterium]